MNTEHQPDEVVHNRYRIVRILGRGGGGLIYETEDLTAGGRVALKQLVVRGLDGWKTFDLFAREARVLANLDHPAIPRYLDHFQMETPAGPMFYLAQALVEGQSLAALAERGWRASQMDLVSIAAQVLEVVRYLHGLVPPVVHRDIKPHNLIRSADGHIHLVDFGAVQRVGGGATLGGSTIAGTFGFMAPEQFQGQATASSDLYGLGATLVFLLTGKNPADLPQRKLRILFRDRVTVASPLVAWIERMTEPAPEDRFGSATEALAALQRCQAPAKPDTRWRMIPLVAFCVGLLAAVMTTPHGARNLVVEAGTSPASPANDDTFCRFQQSRGLVVCDDFSSSTPSAPRWFRPWVGKPSLRMYLSDGALVFDDPGDFAASYVQFGDETDFLDTALEVDVTAETEARSTGGVSWGGPVDGVGVTLQRDERMLYIHVLVKGEIVTRLSAPAIIAPRRAQRVRMEIRANGQLHCLIDGAVVLTANLDLSALPRKLAPTIGGNAYPRQRFIFDNFVLRRLQP